MSERNEQRVVLVPAAGFGRRVGSPEAKELFMRQALVARLALSGSAAVNGDENVNEKHKDEPLIEQPLRLGQMSGAKVVVVTRQEKQSLVQYLQDRECEVLFVPSTRDWAESLLLSKSLWGETNVVCLPDVNFAPHAIVGEMFDQLERCDMAFATFLPSVKTSLTVTTQDLAPFATWGVVDSTHHLHCEKPQSLPPENGAVKSSALHLRAWGLFGFRREMGEQLLRQMLESTFDHQWRKLPGRVTYLPLTHFADLTRG